jgi:hypothetical protein
MFRITEAPEEVKVPAGNPIDLREALCNDGPVGAASGIQVPAERITRLLGFVYDLDPKLLVPDNTLFAPADDPRRFHELIRPVLDRHRLARHAEVRSSGTGLHLINALDPPVELDSAADQSRWAVLVRAAQCSLPTDPNAPGITALTRPVGSVNSKNGATVEVLRPGEPIDPARVVEFVGDLAEAPFRTIAAILLGADHVEPCPVCRAAGSRLGVLDHAGRCYRCGKVRLEQLYETVLRSEEPSDPEATGAEPPAAPSAKPRRRHKDDPAKAPASAHE